MLEINEESVLLFKELNGSCFVYFCTISVDYFT